MKRNKKTIAIIIATLILAIVATVGTVMYLNDDGTAQAGFEGNEPSISTDNNNSGTEENNNQDSPEQNNGATEENQPGNLPEAGQNANQGTVANNNNNNNNGTSNRGTTTTTTENANVPNQEYVTERIEEVERQISEDLLVGWTPLSINSAYSTSDLGIYKPELEILKVSQTADENNAISEGDTLIYVLAVRNAGNDDVTGINVSDIIPEQTTVIEKSIVGEGTYNKELNKINWKVDVKAGETVAVGFAVIVNEDATGTIKNAGTINGKNTEEVLNPVITSEKIAQIYRNDEPITGPANIGDKIEYTVIAKNTGNVEATVFMQDSIPVNTKLVSAIELAGEEIDEQTMNNGTNVKVPAGEIVKLTFTVEVTAVDGIIKNIATVGTTKPDNEVKTANLEIAKTVANKIDGEYGENVTLKLGEIAYFKIELKNTGSEDLDVTMQDIMNGADIKLFDGEIEVKETVEVLAGETKTLTATYKMTQSDIDNQETLKNIAIATTPVTPGIEDDAEITPEEAKPGIAVDKTATKVNGEEITENTKVSAGDKVTYQIVVTNTGKVTLHNIEVTDDLVSSFKETIESLAPNASETYTVEYTVTQADVDNKATIVNTATATDGTTTGKDTDETVPTDKTPGIAVNKTATKVNGENITENTKVRAGDVITYTITVTNTGKITLKDVKVIDKELNVNYNRTEIVAGSPIDTISSLAPNESKSYSVTYTVTENDIANKVQIENTAIATDGTTTDEKPSNPVPVNPNVTLTGTKSWNDNENQNGVRPDNITIAVISSDKTDKTERIQTIGKNQDGTYDWTYEFTGLPKYDANNNQIEYTVVEDPVIRYAPDYTDRSVDENGNVTANIKNTLKPLDLTNEKKTSTTNSKNGGNVAPGTEIKYTILITNNSDEPTGTFEVRDSVPVGTTLKTETNPEYTTDENNEWLTWKVSLNGKESKTVSFTVITDITLNDGDKIRNKAIVDGKDTNEVVDTVKNIVRTVNVKEHGNSISKTNIVMVLDLSSSMTKNGSTRLANAKSAAIEFIDNIYTDSNVSGVNIEIITFNTREAITEKVVDSEECTREKNPDHYTEYWDKREPYYTHNEEGTSCTKHGNRWYTKYIETTQTVPYSGTKVLEIPNLEGNVAKNYDDAQKIKNAINAIEIPAEYKERGFGTHMYAALQLANTEISNLKTKHLDNDNAVVFLGDGMPFRGKDYPEYNDNTDANIKSEAGKIRTKATLYAIRYAEEVNLLKDVDNDGIASKGCSFASTNLVGLKENFQAIKNKAQDREITTASQNGYLVTINPTGLIVSAEKPVTIRKNGTVIATYTSINALNNSGLVNYDETTKKITWNVRNYEKNDQLEIEYYVN